MADGKRSFADLDRGQVSLREGYLVSYWTAKFGVSRDMLADAVAAVGHSADAVERYLKG